MSEVEKWKRLKIQFTTIKDATNNFERLIGSGGYGSVYEGKLLINEKYIDVAVKRLDEKFGQGSKEFLTEIDLLSEIQHDNLITLVGYCDEENEKILVYEYAKNGSLERYITPSNTCDHNLTWLERLQIVVDAARGLDHLHNHLLDQQVIIHRDIKSSNILLDHNRVAKISDFGLSKSTFGGLGRSTVITRACGTEGYAAPEVVNQSCLVTIKSDVYSFGMVLFEVLCGRLCYKRNKDGILLTAEVAKQHYSNNKLDKIIDPILKEQMIQKSLETYSSIAYRCLQDQHQRPLIEDVKKKLEEALSMQVFYTQRPEENHLQIPSSVIKDATKNSKVIRREFESVEYEGDLLVHGVYTRVLVRCYFESYSYNEFYANLELLIAQQHENVITLVGYCDEEYEMCIVYEYAEHGSLNQYIRCRNMNHSLTWLERLKIIVDVAGGLDHLHKHVGQHGNILYMNISSSNILLYDKWVAKISDVEMAKSGVTLSKNDFPRVWYKQPNLYISIGMVLFELLCGRLSIFQGRSYDDGLLILSRKAAKQRYARKELDKIIDPNLRKQMSLESLTKFSAIAYKCLQGPPYPPLADVKKELKETLKLEVFHWRSFFSRHWYILNSNDLSSDTNVMHEDTKRLKGLSRSLEEDTSDDDHGNRELPNRYAL